MWVTGNISSSWKTARIMPIFKGGDNYLTIDYRGISLLDVGYKILTRILDNRLTNWLENNAKLKETQRGFKKNRATRDHIFVLNSLINNKLKKQGGKLFVAFIDLKKAFDMVDRKLLFQKLEKRGVNGRMLKMIKKR